MPSSSLRFPRYNNSIHALYSSSPAIPLRLSIAFWVELPFDLNANPASYFWHSFFPSSTPFGNEEKGNLIPSSSSWTVYDNYYASSIFPFVPFSWILLACNGISFSRIPLRRSFCFPHLIPLPPSPPSHRPPFRPRCLSKSSTILYQHITWAPRLPSPPPSLF